jgi:predicted nucleic acid-binding protein
MVVVDSSALIPLAWVGRLKLISTAFDEIRTTELVQDEQGITERFELSPPEDRELRLNTAILTNREIHDLHRSTWQSSPNN